MINQLDIPKKRLAQLRQILIERFDEGELRTLCTDLGVDYENLPDAGKANKARELVEYLNRRNLIPELVDVGRRRRPDISWISIPKVTEKIQPIAQVIPSEQLSVDKDIIRLDLPKTKQGHPGSTLSGQPHFEFSLLSYLKAIWRCVRSNLLVVGGIVSIGLVIGCVLAISTFISRMDLEIFPKCTSSSDISVLFRISRGDTVIDTLSLGETVTIEPGATVKLQVEIVPRSNGEKLPALECSWTDSGIGSDGELIHTKGCTVDYRSGQYDISDSVSVHLTQRNCSSLGLYPFFIEREP